MANIGVIFGGRSPEHEVSLASATAVMELRDHIQNHDFCEIGIDKCGNWYGNGSLSYLTNAADKSLLFIDSPRQLTEIPTQVPPQVLLCGVDLLLPVTHGTHGEDGQLQGILEFYQKRYIGCGIIPSSISANKSFLKHFLSLNGYRTAPGVLIDLSAGISLRQCYEHVKKQIGSDALFVKPNSGGSSLGTSKSFCFEDFINSIENAKAFDNKILAEKIIIHREFIVGVIENDARELIVSEVGECRSTAEIYSYEEKYVKGNTEFACPAEISFKMKTFLQESAKDIFKRLLCRGMVRIDFFLDSDEECILVNEVNTIPGLTKSSVFPKVFSKIGIEYPTLIDILVRRALIE